MHDIYWVWTFFASNKTVLQSKRSTTRIFQTKQLSVWLSFYSRYRPHMNMRNIPILKLRTLKGLSLQQLFFFLQIRFQSNGTDRPHNPWRHLDKTNWTDDVLLKSCWWYTVFVQPSIQQHGHWITNPWKNSVSSERWGRMNKEPLSQKK